MIQTWIAQHRILVSRLAAGTLFAALLFTGSANEGRAIEPLLFLAGVVLVGGATVGRLWCSLYLSGYKDSTLITQGPYSLTRNPLYFFSLMGFVGVGLATEMLSFAAVLLLLFVIVYVPVIRREENFLRSKFGDAFERYRAAVPRFFPRLSGRGLSGLVEPERYSVNPRLFRRTMGDVLWFVWLVGIVEMVEALHEYAFAPPLLLP